MLFRSGIAPFAGANGAMPSFPAAAARSPSTRVVGVEPEEADDEDGDGSSASAEARADALVRRLYASLGLLGVYACWTIFAWFIFTYGMLIYRQLGDSAQQESAGDAGAGVARPSWRGAFANYSAKCSGSPSPPAAWTATPPPTCGTLYRRPTLSIGQR